MNTCKSNLSSLSNKTSKAALNVESNRSFISGYKKNQKSNLTLVKDNKTLQKKNKEDERYNCKFCDIQNLSYKEYFKHLEYNCDEFSIAAENIAERFYQTKLNLTNKEIFNLSRVNIISKSTPITETPDPIYNAGIIQDSIDICLTNAHKDYKPVKKLNFVKDIDASDLSIGQIHLKSNQFCVFGLFVKNRYIKYHLAYRINDNNIKVIELLEKNNCTLGENVNIINKNNNSNYNKNLLSNNSTMSFNKSKSINKFSKSSSNTLINQINNEKIDNHNITILVGHKDLVTEIRYFKTKKEYNLLLSCSYDCTLIIWEVSSFNKVKVIDFNTWAISALIAPLKNEEFVFIAGGYSKNSPIKVYELESGEFKFQLTYSKDIQGIPIIIQKYSQNKSNYIFAGTDNENPCFLIFDYLRQTLLKWFQLKNAITSIVQFIATNNNVYVYTSEYTGIIKEYDLLKLKVTTEFSGGHNVLDLLMWDDYYIFAVGEKTGNIKSIIRHKHRVCKTYTDIHSKVVINIQKFYINGYGNCLFTLSADKKIKIFKM